MKFKNIDILLLKHLFKSEDGLFTYTLFQRLRVSPKELFEGIINLVELKYIEDVNEKLTLTPLGREYVINNKLTTIGVKNKFGKIPVEFLGRKISVNEFYLPKNSDIFRESLISETNIKGGTIETSTSEV